MNMAYGYRPQLRMPVQAPVASTPGEVGFDGKMLRKAMARKTVDYYSSTIRYLEVIMKFLLFELKINCFY